MLAWASLEDLGMAQLDTADGAATASVPGAGYGRQCVTSCFDHRYLVNLLRQRRMKLS